MLCKSVAEGFYEPRRRGGRRTCGARCRREHGAGVVAGRHGHARRHDRVHRLSEMRVRVQQGASTLGRAARIVRGCVRLSRVPAITSHSYTVVNRFPNDKDPEKPIYVKTQCMHCVDPACASACLVGALQKQENGAVTYDASKCMGCRYCMVACPFGIPTYEYDNALTPQVRKCNLCFERVAGKARSRPARRCARRCA